MDIKDLFRQLSKGGSVVDTDTSTKVTLEGWVDNSVLAFLCAFGLLLKNNGSDLALNRSDNPDYIARMDLFKQLDLEYPEAFSRHSEAGRFIPLRLIRDGSSVYEAVNAICDLVLHQFDNAAEFIPALEWVVNELIDNVIQHADANIPGVVCAQYYPKPQRIDIAIVDVGQGIRQSLCEYKNFNSHCEAIQDAFRRGVTRNRDIGQGNGLAGCKEIIRHNGGKLQIWSGDALLEFYGENKASYTVIPAVPGTGVIVSLNTNNPVDMKRTFMLERTYTFLDAEANRIAESAGLLVREECIHYGGREPARALRRKIIALLPSMTAPLVLDFKGVKLASSSFLDELIGLLVVHLGKDSFQQSIQVTNASELIIRMADAVINQRLNHPGEYMESDTDIWDW